VDSQGDVVEPEELESAAYEYLLGARSVGEMHLVKGIDRPVEAIVLTLGGSSTHRRLGTAWIENSPLATGDGLPPWHQWLSRPT
jgi:hypothetical protein